MMGMVAPRKLKQQKCEEFNMHEYVSIRTGEIVTGFRAVLKTVWEDFKHYHILNLKWARFSPYYFEG